MATASLQNRKSASLAKLTALFVAVVAGIVVLGWVLVGFAAMNPVATSADPASKKGPLLLEPMFARITGDAGFNPSRRDGGPRITYWQKTDDVIEWRFHVPAAGKYRVELNYSCDTKNAGGQLSAKLAGKSFSMTVRDTGDFKKPVSESLGEVSFNETGWQLLTLQPEKIPGEQLMQLFSVLLTPVP